MSSSLWIKHDRKTRSTEQRVLHQNNLARTPSLELVPILVANPSQLPRGPQTSTTLLSSLKVPLHNLLENTLSPTLNDIAVTGNKPIKIPLRDPTH